MEVENNEVAGLLANLSGVEALHKQMLFNLYRSIDPFISDNEMFESKILSDVMEGGFTL